MTNAMQEKLYQRVGVISEFLVYVLVGITPIFFLPFTADFFDYNKQMLIFAGAILAVIAWTAQTLIKRMLRLTVSPATLAVVAVAVAYLLSSFFATPYLDEALLGKSLLIFSLTVLFIFATSVGREMKARWFLVAATIGGLLASALTALEFAGFGLSKLMSFLLKLDIGGSNFFHPTGSILAGALFLAPLIVANGVEAFAKKSVWRVVHGVFAGVLTAAFIFHIWLMLPGKPTSLTTPSFGASWSIAIDTLKDPRTAFLGVGPESYLVAFTQFRPANMNLTPTWNLRFLQASNEPLNLLTTLGVVGFCAWIFLIIAGIKTALPLKTESRSLVVLLGVAFLEQLFFPANPTLLVLVYLTLVALVLLEKQKRDSSVSDLIFHVFAIKIVSPDASVRTEQHVATTAVTVILSIALLAGAATSAYVVGKTYAQEHLLFTSLVAGQKNDVVQRYDLQSKLTTEQPRNDRYHRAFAGTNYLLANAIASSPQASEEDKAKVPQLIQQSIREAKFATDLSPRNVLNWEGLATVYRSLVNVAKDADQWAIAAYVRAIQTDPLNPQLRVDLGQVYVGIQNYDQAVRIFQQATELKPDWPIAYLNLANAYQLKGENALAIDNFKQVLQLLPKDDADRPKIEQVIADLEKAIKAKAPAATPKTTPSKAATTSGQIRLPEDLGLPQATPPSTTPGQ